MVGEKKKEHLGNDGKLREKILLPKKRPENNGKQEKSSRFEYKK